MPHQLLIPSGNQFRTVNYPESGIRPSSNFGTTVTASATPNTYGTYTSLITAIGFEVWGIAININTGSTAATDVRSLLTIGKDEAGGSSFTDYIPDLICGKASTFDNFSGFNYYFPMLFKSGSSIGAKLQSSVASQTIRVSIRAFGAPAYPEATKVGSILETFGVVAATSEGTALTPGTTSEGVFTAALTANKGVAAREFWWWQLGYSISNTVAVAQLLHVDVYAGDATTKRRIIEPCVVRVDTGEAMCCDPHIGSATIASGDLVYARSQSSATPETGHTVAVYAVAG